MLPCSLGGKGFTIGILHRQRQSNSGQYRNPGIAASLGAAVSTHHADVDVSETFSGLRVLGVVKCLGGMMGARTIRAGREVLSLVASTDRILLDTHALETGLKAAPHLLKSAAVYGANASGKSNLIMALQYMRGVVLESAALQPGQTFDRRHPFRLDTTSSSLPTEFEVTFILDGVRYQYGFAMNSQRIVGERLLVFKAFKPQRWFERHFAAESVKDVYEFGTGLKGAKNLWEGATRPNALFLSTAVQLNSDVLRPVFDWFANRLVIFNEHSPLSPQFSVQMLKEKAQREAICDFLRAADISIADIEVATKQAMVHSIRFDLATGKREEEAGEQAVEEARRAGYARILIVTEGSKTEPLHLEELRTAHQLHSANVEVQPGQLGTAPIQVVRYARKLFERGDLHKGIRPKGFDQVHAVFDRDDHDSYSDALNVAQSIDGKLRNDDRQPVSFKAIASIPTT